MMDQETLFAWVVLPLLIFAARAFDMTLSTLRILFVTQGKTRLAPVIGFFEILIWVVVISQVLEHISNPLCAVAYAAGYAAGNYLGLALEQRLAMGMQILRIILPSSSSPQESAPEIAAELGAELRREGFGVTVVDGAGAHGPVKILFTLARRRDVERILEIVRRHHAAAFYSIEDVRRAAPEVYPRLSPAAARWLWWDALRKSR